MSNMKKKWKQLSKPHRQLVFISGIFNVCAFAAQFPSLFRLSVWLAGVGNGMFIVFILITFGFLESHLKPVCPEVFDNE